LNGSIDEDDPGQLLEREMSMANEEQLATLKEGYEIWNKWRKENPNVSIELEGADLSGADLCTADLSEADLVLAKFSGADLSRAHLSSAFLVRADLSGADLSGADLSRAYLMKADLSRANLMDANLSGAHLQGSNFSEILASGTVFVDLDLREAAGLDDVHHMGPSTIGTNTLTKSVGKIPEVFLRGCGLSDWETEETKLYNPDLRNDEINKILYRIHDLRANQALQISPLFISYSHADETFINRLEKSLIEKGIRYWRDIHEMRAGRIETQIDRGIRQNPTVLLILSEHSLSSDWVEHEVRTARQLEKDLDRDVLCPVALDDSWKNSSWPKRVMEQIMEYNILDFSEWQDDSKFDGMFRRLIDGLELFYKG
jgi:uncharacterized protein YjbI with pentapeptide repeats